MSSRFPYDRNTSAELIPFTLKDDLIKDSAARGYAPWLYHGQIDADVRDLGSEYVVEADLPGARGRIDVEMDGNLLTIRVNGASETNEVSTQFVSRERQIGTASRSFRLDGVDEKGVTASYADGVLSVRLPKTGVKGKEPHRIEIQ